MTFGLNAQSSKNINDLFLEGATIEWNRFYAGKIAGTHDCELQLAYDGFNCKGFLKINSSNEAFVLEGSLEDEKLQLVEKHNGLPASYINGQLKDNFIDLEWQAIGGDRVTEASFVSRSDLNVKGAQSVSLNKMSEHGNYYNFFIDKRINLPRTKNQKFQKWILDKANGFEREINKKIKQTNLKSRSQILGVVDHNLFFESEDLINGELIFYSSWSEMQIVNFVYDLKNNKEIKFHQLVLRGPDSEEELRALITKQNGIEENRSIEGYNEWFASVNIQDVKVRENGLEFSTTFDPIFGKETVEINCSDLKDFIKKNYYKKLVCTN